MKAMNKPDKLALFNAAMGVTIRLNHILNKCYDSAQRMEPYSWYHHLNSFQREIYCKLSEEPSKPEKKSQREITDNMLKELKLLINDHLISKTKGAVSNKLYTDLDNCEKYLRDRADEHEMLNPNKGTVMDMMQHL